jgi:serine/threonine protein kinase
MPLSSGDKLGPYDILAPIGAGGMGAVYKARDPRLKRDVAIKVSAAHFSERFEREAHVIAALNHSNICQIYDVGPDYLVMEYIEGAPLKGPLPIDQALRYAEQICDALDAAHRKGITHRDLKPANILVPKSGIKLLDFGLAKIGKPERPSSDATLTMALTGKNEIVGTLYYMSPEQLQATGREIDGRSDIFSFGLVLYEMLTGRRAFEGSSPASVIAAIMERPAPSIADVAPPALDRLLKRCLEKDPDNRWQTARDLKAELEWIASARKETVVDSAPHRSRFAAVGWILAAVMALVAGWTLFASRPASTVPDAAPAEVAFFVPPPAGMELGGVGGLSVDRVSPDGSAILFRASNSKFYLRRLNSEQNEPLPDWRWGGDPFWSPDSQSIAFPTAEQLLKMRVPKGAQALVTGLTDSERGGSWGENGTAILSEGAGLYAVSASGGTAQLLEVAGLPEGRYYNPEFLPGGENFLFFFQPGGSRMGQIYMATWRSGKASDPHPLMENETSAAFTPAGGGRILFVRKDNLYSQRLDLGAGKLVGDSELVQERVASFAPSRVAYFSVSGNGTIAWRSGTAVVSEVTVFDRKGNRLAVAGIPAPIQAIGLSPDEKSLFADSEAGQLMMDAEGVGSAPLNLGVGRWPLWSPDGLRLVFLAGGSVYETPARGSGDPRKVIDIPGKPARVLLRGVSADGSRILYSVGYGTKNGCFWMRLDGRSPPEAVALPGGNSALSPDDTWAVSHPGTESGIYAQPLDGRSLPRQLGPNGFSPVWRADGKEILYSDGVGKIWSVRVEGQAPGFRFAPPELLFSAARPLGLNSAARPLAVNRDGSRIYFLQSTPQPDAGVIQVRTRAVH